MSAAEFFIDGLVHTAAICAAGACAWTGFIMLCRAIERPTTHKRRIYGKR